MSAQMLQARVADRIYFGHYHNTSDIVSPGLTEHADEWRGVGGYEAEARCRHVGEVATLALDHESWTGLVCQPCLVIKDGCDPAGLAGGPHAVLTVGKPSWWVEDGEDG